MAKIDDLTKEIEKAFPGYTVIAKPVNQGQRQAGLMHMQGRTALRDLNNSRKPLPSIRNNTPFLPEQAHKDGFMIYPETSKGFDRNPDKWVKGLEICCNATGFEFDPNYPNYVWATSKRVTKIKSK